jgi:hypothetical protein
MAEKINSRTNRMIALIGSTLFPPPVTDKTSYRGTLSPATRIQQTQGTIRCLASLGYESIFLADNSGFNWKDGTETDMSPATVLRINTFQFNNKGLSEIYLLLAALQALPEDRPILKITGRYTIDNIIDTALFSQHEVICRQEGDTISTRGYYVRNKRVLQSLLLDSLEWMYSYGARVVGPKSLARFIKNQFRGGGAGLQYAEPGVMIEKAMWECIKKRYKYLKISRLGLSGVLAGSSNASERIDE